MMNNMGYELSVTTIEYLRSLCDSMRNIQKSHGDNVRIGFFSGRTVGITTEGSEAERELVNFFHRSGVSYSADEGLEMNIVLVMSKIEEIEPFLGAASANSGNSLVPQIPTTAASPSSGISAPQRYTLFGNILACPGEDIEVGRGVERCPDLPGAESSASASGYVSPINPLTPTPVVGPVVHDVIELPEGLEQNLLQCIDFCDQYCHRHELSWDIIHNGLHRLKLNQTTLEKMNGFLRKVNEHPEHSKQHFAWNQAYGQSETETSLQNNAKLFNKVSQLIQFMFKDADNETVSAMAYQAAARQEDDCHDQTLSIVDRLFAERHLFGIKKTLAECRGIDVDWPFILIEMKKRFHQDSFDHILGNIRYNSSGYIHQLIEHPEYITLHGMFKKLFSYNARSGAGVCVFPDDSSSLLFDHWEGTVFVWKNIFHQFTDQFLECIQSEDRFINFLKDAFDDNGEGSLGEFFDKIPEVSRKLSVVEEDSYKLLENLKDSGQGDPSLFTDLAARRTEELRQVRAELIRDKVIGYKKEVENALPIYSISIDRLDIKAKSVMFSGGGRVYQANVVQVKHR